MADGFVAYPAVSEGSEFAISGAVIDDIIVRIPVAVVFSSEEKLDALIGAFMVGVNCGRRFDAGLTVGSSIRQLCSGQDEVYTCRTKITDKMGVVCEYVCGALFDGHGDNSCIRAIRGSPVPIAKLMSYHLDPIGFVHDGLQDSGYRISKHSGSTAIYARMSATSVDCSAVGDSFLFVFINGALVWRSTPHTMANPSEVARHATGSVVALADSYIKLLGTDRITQSPDGLRTHFVDAGLKLVPSMSLGHQNVTGYAPETKRIDFEVTDVVRVVGMSDGVSDMLYLDENSAGSFDDWMVLRTRSADQMVELAHERYRQDWTIVHAGRDYPKQKIAPNQWDDCSAFVLQNY